MSSERAALTQRVDDQTGGMFNDASGNNTSLFNAVMQPDGSGFIKSKADSNGSQAWRAGFGEVSFMMPRISPRPSPWGNPDAPSKPAPQNPGRNDAPPKADNSENGPWDKAPGGPWNKAPGGPWKPGDGGQERPGGGQGQVGSNEASQAFEQDRVTRTEYSFENGVQKYKALGKGNEVAVELQMRDWLNKQSSINPLTFMRGTALISDGLGQFRLEEGSRIDLTSHQDSKPRILKGYDYDFGGEATTWMRMAAGSLVEAQQYVRGHKGLVIEGQAMDDAYIQQLKNLQTNVESKLNKVYGPHDMEGIYSELRNEVRVHSGDWQQGLVRLKYQLDALKSNDSRFVAKSARDVALGFLAEADYMSSKDNGEEAKIMYQAAKQYLSMSNNFDSSAPDNQALATIAMRLRPQIEKAIDNQWSDPFGNPLNLPKPATTLV